VIEPWRIRETNAIPTTKDSGCKATCHPFLLQTGGTEWEKPTFQLTFPSNGLLSFVDNFQDECQIGFLFFQVHWKDLLFPLIRYENQIHC
jgi:hypothetical protein